VLVDDFVFEPVDLYDAPAGLEAVVDPIVEDLEAVVLVIDYVRGPLGLGGGNGCLFILERLRSARCPSRRRTLRGAATSCSLRRRRRPTRRT
jgi:hypothetical protein